MTSKERVLAAARHEVTDRPPVDYWTRRDVRERLTAYMGLSGAEELYQKLGIDSRKFGVKVTVPSFEAKVNGTLGGQSEKSRLPYVFLPDGSYADAWGIRFKPSEDGLYDEWVGGPFSEDPDLDSFDWPDLSCVESVESIRARIAPYNEYALFGMMNSPFKCCWQMRGLEDYLCDTLEDPAYAKELWERNAQYELQKSINFVRAGGDLVGFSGDVAMQTGMMVSLNAWRSIDKPILADMIQKIKAVNPKTLIFFHSDGNMEKIIMDLVEIGVDVINPIQPECMDVERIHREYGKYFMMHGMVSIQELLPHGTREDVRREVGKLVRMSRENGGMMIAPSNHTQNDAPLENIIEVYRACGSYAE